MQDFKHYLEKARDESVKQKDWVLEGVIMVLLIYVAMKELKEPEEKSDV